MNTTEKKRTYLYQYRHWTAEEESLLKSLVSQGKYSYRQMEAFFPGRSLNSLTSHARQYLNIYNDKYENRRYQYNETFLDKPDVLNCYVCGFVAADGCIQYPEKQSPTLGIEVIDSDIDHLNGLKGALGYTGVTKWHPAEGKKTVSFRMSCSYEYAKKLANTFGIIPRKANHLNPPNLSSLELRLSYLLGLLDGDGCVHICKQKNILSISFASSSSRATEWYKQMMEELNLPTINKPKPVKMRKLSHCNAYSLCYAGARAVAFVKLIQSFYKAHNLPILKRKWDNPRLNQYIVDFGAKYPSFSYQPPVFSV